MKPTGRTQLVTYPNNLIGGPDQIAIQKEYQSRNGRRKQWRYLASNNNFEMSGSTSVWTWPTIAAAEKYLSDFAHNKAFKSCIVRKAQ